MTRTKWLFLRDQRYNVWGSNSVTPGPPPRCSRQEFKDEAFVVIELDHTLGRAYQLRWGGGCFGDGRWVGKNGWERLGLLINIEF